MENIRELLKRNSKALAAERGEPAVSTRRIPDILDTVDLIYKACFEGNEPKDVLANINRELEFHLSLGNPGFIHNRNLFSMRQGDILYLMSGPNYDHFLVGGNTSQNVEAISERYDVEHCEGVVNLRDSDIVASLGAKASVPDSQRSIIIESAVAISRDVENRKELLYDIVRNVYGGRI